MILLFRKLRIGKYTSFAGRQRKKGKKTAGDIRDLEAALRLCTQLEVDVVNLSAVSSLLSDSKYLMSPQRGFRKRQ